MKGLALFLVAVTQLAVDSGWTESAVKALPAEPIELAVDLSDARIRIPDDFLGLSFEMGELLPDANQKLTFTPDNLPLITMLKTMGVKNLRFGGNDADAENKTDPKLPGIDAMFDLGRIIDARVIYTVRFSQKGKLQGFVPADPQAAAMTCQHILEKYPDRLAAFTIGNEPDMYFRKLKGLYPTNGAPVEKVVKERRAYEKFRAAWQAFAAVITATNPAAKFNGPSSTGNPNWAKWYGQDFAKDDRIAFVSNHSYPGGDGKKGEAELKLKESLSPEWHNLYADYLRDNGFPEPGNHPFRIEECNSYFNGGAPNMSDTMASALWSLDYCHWMAARGCAGINFQTSARSRPSYGCFYHTPNGFALTPIGYGLTLLSLGSHGESVPLAIRDRGINLSAYAVVGRDGNLYVTLINKEYDTNARSATVRLNLKGRQLEGRGENLALCAPNSDVRAKMGVTLGGASVAENGVWLGRWEALPAKAFGTNGSFSIIVPPASALLVRLPVQKSNETGKVLGLSSQVHL